MKENIIEQSIRLFVSKGFSETSIQDIVDSLGVTKGTFYYYFNSKEELLMDIHLLYINELLLLQQKILEDDSKDCKTKLYELVRLLIKKIEKQGSSARVFYREMRNLKEKNLHEIIQKRDAFRLELQELIQTGIAQKEFRQDLDSSIVTFAILGICNWSYSWFNPKGPLTDEEVIHTFVEMILNGIRFR